MADDKSDPEQLRLRTLSRGSPLLLHLLLSTIAFGAPETRARFLSLRVSHVPDADSERDRRSFGLNPEEILTREALEKPHRTVIGMGIETSHVDTLLEALKHKLKEELTAETPTQLKTVEITA